MKTLLLFLSSLLASVGTLLGQATIQLDKTTYTPGDPIVATWTGSTSGTDWIGIYPRGEVPDGNPVSTSWAYVSGAGGSLQFTTPSPIGVGQWSAWFLANDGYSQMPGTAAVDFAVANPFPEITTFTRSSNFHTGTPVTLSWTLTQPEQITSLTLSDGTNPPVNVLGQTSYDVSPSATTTYTLDVNAGTATATALVMVAVGNSPALSLDKTEYLTGEPTLVTWAGATANPDSWIGIYAAGNTPQLQTSTQWNYLNDTRTAGGSVPDGSMSFSLPAGEYYAVLLVDEGYIIERGPIRFRVADPVEEVIKVVSVTRSGNQVTLVWEAKANCEYDVHASATLEGNPLTDWERIEFAVPTGGDGTTSFTETLADPAPARRFYKVFEYETFE